MSVMPIGGDMSKWLIVKRIDGCWHVCPPNPTADGALHGGSFATGAEAISTFAAGGKR